MSGQISRAIVPYLQALPAIWPSRRHAPVPLADKFDLVHVRTRLRNREEVERHLPDIIGRVLARVWIDQRFRDRFAADPKGTLAAYDVFLPKEIEIDFEVEGLRRPCVVVHERAARNKPRKKLLYLQLVMMAGR